MTAFHESSGFAHAPLDAAVAFRQIMNAMARPGTIVEVAGATPPIGLSCAAAVTLLTLCDPDTPVFLAPHFDTKEIRDWITFQTGAPFAPPEQALFAVGGWAELLLDAFHLGTPEYPDRSATIIAELETLEPTGATLRGPGIQAQAHLSLPETDIFIQNTRHFPLGLDFIFTQGARLAALPRTTRVS